MTRSGSAAQPIRIVGLRAGGARPQIRGGVSTFVVQADHVVVEGFDISGGSSSCFFHQGHDVTLRDSVVHDCPGQGILGADQGSGSFLLEYVEVHHTGAGASAHQIRMATDEVAHPGSVFRMQHCYVHDANGGNNVKSRAERNEIYYNWIEGALYHELELIGPDPDEAAAGWSVDLVREDSDVVGNVLRKTTTAFVTRIGGDGTGWSKGRYRFVNNTIITTTGSGAVWRLYDLLESVEMHNNVIVVNGTGGPTIMRAVSGDFMWVSGTNIAGSNNWVASGATSVPSQWTGTITGTSPGLASLTADVRPIAGSPLVDAGAANLAGPAGFAFPSPLWPPAFHPPLQTLAAVGTAEARPIGGPIDIGAFELLGTGGGTGGAGGAGGTGAGGAGGETGGGGTGGRRRRHGRRRRERCDRRGRHERRRRERCDRRRRHGRRRRERCDRWRRHGRRRRERCDRRRRHGHRRRERCDRRRRRQRRGWLRRRRGCQRGERLNRRSGFHRRGGFHRPRGFQRHGWFDRYRWRSGRPRGQEWYGRLPRDRLFQWLLVRDVERDVARAGCADFDPAGRPLRSAGAPGPLRQDV